MTNCPNCNSENITCRAEWQEIPFHDDQVARAMIPVLSCEDCKFEFMDQNAEAIRALAVKEAIAENNGHNVGTCVMCSEGKSFPFAKASKSKVSDRIYPLLFTRCNKCHVELCGYVEMEANEAVVRATNEIYDKLK